MELEDFKQKFNLPRINKYQEMMSEEQIQYFWHLLFAIKEIFPTIDIYHAGFNLGYLGFGNKGLDVSYVRDFLFVMHFGRDKNKQVQFILYIADKSFKFEKIKEVMIDQAYDDEVKECIELKEWLLKFKNVALEVGINCDGHSLFPVDYDKNVFFSTDEAKKYLQTRYQQIKPETQKIIGFKNNLNRELALTLENDTPSIFIGLNPKGNEFFDFQFIENRSDELHDEYNKEKSRHSGLEANAPSLYTGNEAYYIEINTLQDLKSLCDWYDLNLDLMLDEKLKEDKQMLNKNNDQYLNRILFGTTGTGKTYYTINHALSIIENKPLEVLEQEDRTALKVSFDQYKEQGQIKFVTFHQSFSYEDFVEGIRAETSDNGQLSYDVKDGVFKEICEDAQIEIYTKQNNVSAPIEANINSAIDQLITQAKTEEMIFHTKRGAEIKVSSNSGGTLVALTSTGSNVPLSIRHIRNYLKIQSDMIVDQKSYEWAIAYSLRSKVKFTSSVEKVKPYVLIIDEINRGNISRIFGELITLIEDSKRQDAEEQLSVILPYSKKEFSVPNSVYIIGTMNSSDRSLIGLDIALRRRFTFIEMPPQPKEIKNENGELLKISGKDKQGNDKDVIVADILSVMNQRIEVLLDRDHCIGHANFMILKKQPTLENLAHIFKQKIIPQLQEYFFDDWAKINLVLNGNGMLQSKSIEKSAIFPNIDSEELDYFEDKKAWELVPTSFDNIVSFTKIIQH